MKDIKNHQKWLIKAWAELNLTELRVFSAILDDAPEFPTTIATLHKSLPRISKNNIRKTIRILMEMGYLVHHVNINQIELNAILLDSPLSTQIVRTIHTDQKTIHTDSPSIYTPNTREEPEPTQFSPYSEKLEFIVQNSDKKFARKKIEKISKLSAPGLSKDEKRTIDEMFLEVMESIKARNIKVTRTTATDLPDPDGEFEEIKF